MRTGRRMLDNTRILAFSYRVINGSHRHRLRVSPVVSRKGQGVDTAGDLVVSRVKANGNVSIGGAGKNHRVSIR